MIVESKYYVERPRDLYDRLASSIDMFFERYERLGEGLYKIEINDGDGERLFSGELYVVRETISSLKYVLRNGSERIAVKFVFDRDPSGRRYFMRIVVSSNREAYGRESERLLKIADYFRDRVSKLPRELGVEPVKDFSSSRLYSL